MPSLVAREMPRLQEFIDEHRDTVLKRLDGMGGAGVFRVRHDDPNRNVIVETISELGTRSVMAQRYIPAIAEGDKRVLLIDGKVVPHCLARIPARATRAATSPPARAAWRSRSARATARSPRRSVRCSPGAGCCWSAST